VHAGGQEGAHGVVLVDLHERVPDHVVHKPRIVGRGAVSVMHGRDALDPLASHHGHAQVQSCSVQRVDEVRGDARELFLDVQLGGALVGAKPKLFTCQLDGQGAVVGLAVEVPH